VGAIDVQALGPSSAAIWRIAAFAMPTVGLLSICMRKREREAQRKVVEMMLKKSKAVA
jgi:hypothetical protein